MFKPTKVFSKSQTNPIALIILNQNQQLEKLKGLERSKLVKSCLNSPEWTRFLRLSSSRFCLIFCSVVRHSHPAYYSNYGPFNNRRQLNMKLKLLLNLFPSNEFLGESVRIASLAVALIREAETGSRMKFACS